MVVIKTACLQWICMLLSRSGAMLEQDLLNNLFDPIFRTLSHPDTEVVV